MAQSLVFNTHQTKEIIFIFLKYILLLMVGLTLCCYNATAEPS